jgi:hypothetical protein
MIKNQKSKIFAILKNSIIIASIFAIIYLATISFALETDITLAVTLLSVLFLAYLLRENDKIKNNVSIRFIIISTGLFLTLHYLY